MEDSGLSNHCDGHFQAGNPNGEFRSLPCRRVFRKPFNPLFIHSGEIGFFEEDDGAANDAIERTAGGLEDGGYVLETLPGLLLNGFRSDLSGCRILRPCPGDEHETRSAQCLAVGWGRGWSVRGSNDVDWHGKEIVSQAPHTELRVLHLQGLQN